MKTNYISKIFSGAIFSGILFLALFGISASNAKAARITVKKDVCDSINPTTNACNGNNKALEDQTIQFTVEVGTLSGTDPVVFTPSGGAALPNIPVTINLGGGSNGQTTTDNVFTQGTTVRVCEIVPAGFDATPQPEGSTGGSDTFA